MKPVPPIQNPPTQKPSQVTVVVTPCPCVDSVNYWMDVQGQWHQYGERVVFVGEWWMDASGAWHQFI